MDALIVEILNVKAEIVESKRNLEESKNRLIAKLEDTIAKEQDTLNSLELELTDDDSALTTLKRELVYARQIVQRDYDLLSARQQLLFVLLQRETDLLSRQDECNVLALMNE